MSWFRVLLLVTWGVAVGCSGEAGPMGGPSDGGTGGGGGSSGTGGGTNGPLGGTGGGAFGGGTGGGTGGGSGGGTGGGSVGGGSGGGVGGGTGGGGGAANSRDAGAGGGGGSAAVDAGQGGDLGDFARRCAQPGVVKCVGFDDASDFNIGAGGTSGAYGQNAGLFAPSGTSDYTRATQDVSVKASGKGSLKFTIPSNSGSDTSGSYFTNFSSDLSVQFGANEEFYVQWRQRFSQEQLSTMYTGSGGFKQLIIGAGDQPGGPFMTSCTALELVTQNGYQRGFPIMYNSCTGSTSHGAYWPLEQPFASQYNNSDFKLQNARPAPYCLYSGSSHGYFAPNGNCFGYVPDEWMTFQVHLKLGPRVNDEFVGSTIGLTIARDGQPSEPVFDFGPFNLSAGAPSENLKYGKVWLLPYQTGKDSSQSHPVAYTWYDELIVSRQLIADPGKAPTPVDGGVPTFDAGAPVVDAGTPVVDAGSPKGDAGTGGGVIDGGTLKLAELAASMPSDSWAQLTSATGRELWASPLGEGAGGIRNAYATKLAFDPATKKMYFIGDDHNAPLHFFIYDETTNAWSEGPALPWSVSEGSADHGYEHTVYVPAPVSSLYRRRHRGMELWRWGGDTSWSSFSLKPGLNYGSAASGIEWFPDVGKIVVFQDENGIYGAIVGYDPVSGAQTVYVSGSGTGSGALLPNTGDPHNFAHYNPSKHLVWFGGGNGATTSWTMDAAGTITAMPAIPAAVGSIGPGNGMSLPVYNPANGQFLVFVSPTVRYDFDPSGAGTWVAHTGVNNRAWANNVYDSSEPMYGTQACPRPDLGVIVFMKGVGRSSPAEMWLYKP